MAEPFVNGTSVKVRGLFRNASDALTDPTTVVFLYKDPRGQTTRYVYGTDSELTKNATGDYQVLITGSLAGRYSTRWESIGGVSSAGEDGFTVKENRF